MYPLTGIRFSKYAQLIIVLSLAAVTLGVYWQVLGHGFVFDDEPYVVENRHVHGGLTWHSVKWCFTGIHGANWHPLTSLSHTLDCELFGLTPLGHHAANLLFHIANTVLLLLVLKRMTGSLWRSGFVAALFALHPLHVESVAWIAERKDVLSTFFWLLTIWAYVRYVDRPRPGRYTLVVLALALGLMAKPMLVSLPVVLLLLDYWPLGRLSLGSAGKKSRPWAGWALIREKIPLFGLSVASSIITCLAQQKGGALIELQQFPFGIRVANALVSYIQYIWKMFWPKGLAAFYPHPLDTMPSWQVAGACLLLAGISVLAIRGARRRPYLGVGWLWYVITLVPVIGLVQVGEQAMADRYTYVPLVGLFIVIAWGAPDLLGHGKAKGGKAAGPTPAEAVGSGRVSVFPVLPILAGAVIAALMVCTWRQVPYWHSNITLFQRAVRVTGRNARAHNNLGIALADQGRLGEAVEHYSRALEIEPVYPDAHHNLGNTLLQQGKIDEAEEHYGEALRINPKDQKASLGLLNVAARRGGTGQAVAGYRKILSSNPNDADAHYSLGVMLTRQGKMDEAISHYSRALEINPRHPRAHNNLGTALLERDELEKAVAHFSEAVRIKPNYPQAHHNLGKVLAERGELDKALQHLTTAVRMKPDWAEAHNNLGVVLAQQNRIDDAMTHFSEAVRLSPTFADPHYNLGLALTGQGKIDEAILRYSKALQIKPDYGEARRNLAVALYLKGEYAKAWREVHACRRYGVGLNPAFIAALSQAMPDPGR